MKAFVELICTAFAILCMFFAVPKTAVLHAEEETQETETEEETVEVTVVEEIEAVEIAEPSVPLASPVPSRNSTGIRHCIEAGILLAMTLCYTAYFRKYEQKLHDLRLEAAGKEDLYRRQYREKRRRDDL